jgi:hypothetical protein
MTINEARARKNLPRIDEDYADEPVRPMNVLYGGQPAPNVPTETPATVSINEALARKGLPPVDDPLFDIMPGAYRDALPPAKKKKKKAVPASVIKRRDKVAQEHEALLRKHFDRQSRAIRALLGAMPKSKLKVAGQIDMIWDADRWNRELTTDLSALAMKTAGNAGARAATQLGGTYDEMRTLNYLTENSRIAAENINFRTKEYLADAIVDPSGDEINELFTSKAERRANVLGIARASNVINFARHEAAAQIWGDTGRDIRKRWHITDPTSRHKDLEGETLELDRPFSNGLRFPGEASQDNDESIGCKCVLALVDQENT